MFGENPKKHLAHYILISTINENTIYCAFNVLYGNKKGLGGKKKFFY